MPSHSEHRLLPYSPDQLFDMVADVKNYPQFVPWCQGARIQTTEPTVVTADLVIGFATFRETFTSHVSLNRPHEVMVSAVEGPLEHLSNQWVFTPVRTSTRVDFAVDFQFKSHLLDHLANVMFHGASVRMMSAFEARAHELYKSH